MSRQPAPVYCGEQAVSAQVSPIQAAPAGQFAPGPPVVPPLVPPVVAPPEDVAAFEVPVLVPDAPELDAPAELPPELWGSEPFVASWMLEVEQPAATSASKASDDFKGPPRVYGLGPGLQLKVWPIEVSHQAPDPASAQSESCTHPKQYLWSGVKPGRTSQVSPAFRHGTLSQFCRHTPVTHPEMKFSPTQ
jgi:hypothetical protein